MFPLVVFGAVLCAVCHTAPNAVAWTQLNEAPSDVEEAWSNFKKDHGKSYLSAEEETMRKLIFAENLKKIEAHNYLHDKGLSSFRKGINQFTDMTTEEFSTKMNKLKIKDRKNIPHNKVEKKLSPKVKNDLPEEVDWRMKGFVSPVKDQGDCGSCYTFSAVGALEGQHFRKTGNLVLLSEQNLVDCSEEYGNNGCNGGFMNNAFAYIMDHGIDTAASYPYIAKEQSCKFNKKFIGANVSTFVDVIPSGDEEKLKQAVASEGPVSIGIDASHDSFRDYTSGVYDEPACNASMIGHAVLVVGYGRYDEQDYWLVKNSYGTSWGDKGYVLMSRNKDNQCGIASVASFPLV